MRLHQLYRVSIGTGLILLALGSASEAGWFRGRNADYYAPTRPASSAVASQASLAPAGNTAAALPGGAAGQADRITVPDGQPPAAPSSSGNDASTWSRGAGSSGWSVMPRSSWDFGRFPPYF